VRSTRRPLVVVAAGLAAVALYLGGAAISGHVRSPLRSRVLFDGFAPPPPYRWVSPPPALAGSNQSPAGAAATIPLSAAGSDGASVLTPDSQASLFLVKGAIPPSPGRRSVHVEIQPSPPPRNARTPDGFEFDGNVYVFTARYEPSGDPITELSVRSTIVLVFPMQPPSGAFDHVLMASRDGRFWRQLTTSVASLQHQAAADVRELGFYAVGRRQLSAGGGVPEVLRIGVFAALLAAAAAIGYVGWGRRRPA
jgi:hypothetical protein